MENDAIDMGRMKAGVRGALRHRARVPFGERDGSPSIEVRLEVLGAAIHGVHPEAD